MQLAFSAADGAALDCVLRFNEHDYANLDFLDPSQRDVLLHVSFRYRHQVMVYNQHVAGAWGQEQPTPIELAAEGDKVRVAFSGTRASVAVNGATVGIFELPLPGAGATSALHWVRLNGGVADLHVSGQTQEPHRGRGLIVMDRPFLIEGWGFDAGSQEQSLAVELVGTGQTLPLVVLPASDRAREQRAPTDQIGVMALVPGWIWTHMPDGQDALQVRLTANGRPCGRPLILRPDEIAEMIETLCDGELEGNSLEALTALEHARFGAFGSVLSGVAREALARVARKFNVTEFFGPEEDTTPGSDVLNLAAPPVRQAYAAIGPDGRPVAAQAAPLAEEATDLEPPKENDALDPDGGHGVYATAQVPHTKIRAALWDFAARAAQDPDPNLASVLTEMDLTGFAQDELRALLLSLSGAFCAHDQFSVLFRVAEDTGLGGRALRAKGVSRGQDLAFLYSAERSADLLAGLASLSEEEEGPVDVRTLGWVMRKLLRERPAFLSEEAREQALLCYLDYLSAVNAAAHGPLTGEDLLTTACAVVEAIPTLSDDLQDDTARRITTLYATSARFWELIEADLATGALTALPRPLLEARMRFTAFREALESGRFRDSLQHFVEGGLDRPDLRRELVAAARSQGLSLHDAIALAEAGQSPNMEEADDALLRNAAFPIATPEAQDLTQDVRHAIRRSLSDVPRSPHPNVQRAAGHKARLILDGGESGTHERDALLDAFFTDCATLGSSRSDYLGPALAIALLNGALVNADADLAALIPERYATLLTSLSDEEQLAALASHAVRTALWELRQAPGARRSRAARIILDTFGDAEADLPEAVDPSETVFGPRTSVAAFHGIVVVVSSTECGLTTHIPALRNTWLADLDAMGIPYLIAVGGGNGEIEGDVLFLDAPDGAEAQPQKSLALMQWLTARTSFSHVLKLDDMSHLNVDEAIGGLSYRKYPYYGRRLTRIAGQTDRLAHLTSGGSLPSEIDKSAEPSDYADGACGYTLNRRAMQDVVDTASTRHGAWLRLASFHEDKFVGDMLSLAGIRPSSRDFIASVEPALREADTPGPGVLTPSTMAPVQVARVSDVSRLRSIAETQRRAVLEPKRIWPSDRPANLTADGPQAVLISDLAQLHRVNAADLCVIVCLSEGDALLPAFLEHYRGLGVQGFLICDMRSDRVALGDLSAEADVALFASGAASAEGRLAVQTALMSNLRMTRWSLVVSSDEFLLLPDGCASVADLLSHSDIANADCARILTLDLYPEGKLEATSLAAGSPFQEMGHCDADPFVRSLTVGPCGNAMPWASAVHRRLHPDDPPDRAIAQTYGLVRYKPWMRFSPGMHDAADVRLAPRDLVAARFRYHAGRLDTAIKGAGRHRPLPDGMDRVFDPDLSVPWRDCAWVRSMLGGAPGKP